MALAEADCGGGSVKPAAARHRTDTTASALLAEAKRLGVSAALLGGAIDAALWLGPVVKLCDFKSKGGELTEAQSKLVARGCPIAFVSDVPQLEALVAEMKREALR